MALQPDQQKAADEFGRFLLDPTATEMVIEGGPGSGKSFMTAHLIQQANGMSHMLDLLTSSSGNKVNMELSATTNKAAAVLSKLANKDAGTIHSLIGLKLENNYSTGKKNLVKARDYAVQKNTIILIDEASYENAALLNMIRASTVGCKLLHIGDRDQLLLPGEVDSVVFDKIPRKVTLTGSQRFKKGGPIAQLSEQMIETIRTGIWKPIVADGKEIIRVKGAEFQSLIRAAYSGPDGTLADHNKIVAWGNKTVIQYNDFVRGMFTKSRLLTAGETIVTNKPIIARTSKGAPNETVLKILQVSKTETHYGISGNRIYFENSPLTAFQPHNLDDVERELNYRRKEAKSGKSSWAPFFEIEQFFADLRPVHASTVYKAQGSTYETVFVNLNDIGKCHVSSTVARMVNVAATRAKTKVVLFGDLPHKYRGK